MTRIFIALTASLIALTALGAPVVAANSQRSTNKSVQAPALESQVVSTSTIDRPTGLFGYKNRENVWAIEPRYKTASDFMGGLAFVENTDGSVGLINAQGAMVTGNVVQAVWASQPTLTEAKISDGLLAAREIGSNKVGFVDTRGRWVIKPRFADAYEFHEGLAAFRMSEFGKVGFVDPRGKVIIPRKFGTNFKVPPVFSEGLAAVGLDDNWPLTNLDPPGKLGYIDRSGRWVIAPKYSSGESFAGGRARVTVGEKEIVIKNPLLR